MSTPSQRRDARAPHDEREVFALALFKGNTLDVALYCDDGELTEQEAAQLPR
jgi:hypothetical protein